MKAKFFKFFVVIAALTALSATAFADTKTGEDSKSKADDDCAKAFNVKTPKPASSGATATPQKKVDADSAKK